MIHLIYLVPGVDNLSAEDVGQELEDALVKRLNDSDLVEANLQFSVFSLRILSREIRKNTSYTFPYISITIVLLVTFTVGSCMTADWLTSKPIEAFMGVISSGLAIIAAAGLMSYCGVPYISQVTVMPFLALAIGVDDAYVMLGAWQETDRDDPPEKRLSATLREAGSAITVTSFTDVLSFTIGVFSTTPSSSIFCKYVAAAILFDYAFQITFFAGIMVLGGRREQSGKHALYIWRSLEAKQLRKV
uniref:SSD domain-containing protein n=1 Tax=Plectus sambesii TaxID=2011161 RepID=A0A914UY03_9BILA